MATELADRLSASDQITVLSAAAARISPSRDGRTDTAGPTGETPTVEEALSRLRAIGVVSAYDVTDPPIRCADGAGVSTVRLSTYALSPRADRLPLLPIVVELFRCRQPWLPVVATATDGESDWRVDFVRLSETIVDRTPTYPVAPEVSKADH